jgi:2-methylcitrate dehydratase PrpD
MLNAIGIAGYILPVSMAEQLMGGYTVKIVQGGQAAGAGIMAAGLAGKGLPAVRLFWKERSSRAASRRYMKVDAKPERITERLGEHYSINDVYFKPYTALPAHHGAAQATLAPKNKKGLSRMTWSPSRCSPTAWPLWPWGRAFRKAAVLSRAVFHSTCRGGLHPRRDAGSRAAHGRRIVDPAIIALRQKVTVKTDDELNKMYPTKPRACGNPAEKRRASGENGGHSERDPRDPMEAGDIAQKVKFFAGSRDQNKVDRIVDTILNLEKVNNIKELASFI